MAYVNVAEWKPEQVTEWLKGLDNVVLLYIHSFLNNEVSGQQLLNLRPDDLDHLGVHKLGHQELILEAVEHLRNFHYELDRENLQLLSLRLACRAHSLHNELQGLVDPEPVSTQTLADVANVITTVMPLVCWLDRSPFSGQLDYHERKCDLLKLSLQMATCAQRDRFAEQPLEEIRSCCGNIAKLADSIIQDIDDPLLLQPASLDLATLKKRAGDDLGFFIFPSFHGGHQIGELKYSSPAHQCGKIENGDEIVQVNYQTVVGWQTKKVYALFEECPTDVLVTLKKRPRHTKVYGQIYMKPYRLPSKKRAAPFTRWHDNLPSPRPELLTIPDFEMPLPKSNTKRNIETVRIKTNNSITANLNSETSTAPLPSASEPAVSSSEEEDDDDSMAPEDLEDGGASPTSMRLIPTKPRSAVQRRATVTGASPTSKRAPINIERFWEEIRRERKWGDTNECRNGETLYQLRDKSASYGNGLSLPTCIDSSALRPTTCLGIENSSANGSPSSFVPNSISNISKNKKKIYINEEENKIVPPPLETHKENELSSKRSDIFMNVAEIIKDKDKAEDNRALNVLAEQNVNIKDSKESFNKCDNKTEKEDSISIRSNSSKERGKLDKSQSTPVYDLNEEKLYDWSKNNKASITEEKVEIPNSPSPLNKPQIPTVKISPPEPLKVSYSSIIAKTLGRATSSSSSSSQPSPKTLRKVNALLAKKRNVSIAELAPADCEGWLSHRCRTGGTTVARWPRSWFILRGSAFYGFKTTTSTKADFMISLPGFTVTPADEVKSRKYAFKIYHTGTVFYFATENETDFNTWISGLNAATIKQEIHSKSSKEGHENPYFSETDSDTEENNADTCFPSPKLKKIAGLLSHDKTNTSPQQNSNNDTPKKFGSLKKLRNRGEVLNSTGTNNENPTSAGGGSSLDRKYLRFLSSKQNVPVPTAQYRSYRRVTPKITSSTPRSSQFYLSSENLNEDEPPPAPPPPPPPSSNRDYIRRSSDISGDAAAAVATSLENKPIRQLKVVDRHIHASNPSLLLPNNLLDYRLTEERLREFGMRRNRIQREDTSGFVTLEAFMLSRQEEERKQQQRIKPSPPPPPSQQQKPSPQTPQAQQTNSATQTITKNKTKQNLPTTSQSIAPVKRSGSNKGKKTDNELQNQNSQGREYRGGSPEKLWLDSLRRHENNSGMSLRRAISKNENGSNKLKTATQYQPLPTQNDESMRYAFEMNLDNSNNTSNNTSKLRQMLTSTSSGQRTLLGSPRLHRAFFREKKPGKGSLTSESSTSSLASPASPPFSPDGWELDLAPCPPPFKANLPTMGVAMIGKKPNILNSSSSLRRAVPSHVPHSPSPSMSSPPPDYPGLEYPPVFEPETYTLSDAASNMIRAARNGSATS